MLVKSPGFTCVVVLILAGLLSGVSRMDLRILLGVVVLLVAVTLSVCYMPACQAAKVDPMTALRCE